jgi:hypothetical protein
MKTIRELTGQTFGRWTVQEKDPEASTKNARWFCACECGTVKSVYQSSLVNGDSLSCGCFRAEIPRGPNLIGQQFGRLTVLSRASNNEATNNTRWNCVCDCGAEKVIFAVSLKDGSTQSCGCLRQEKMSALGSRTKHGMANSPEYYIWEAIVQRCTNPKNPGWKDYGGRGIKNAFITFEEFFAEVGPRPSPKMTIDRIDNEKGYEPGNVRWTDRETNMRNTRSTVMITFRGETLCRTEWAQRLGLKQQVMIWRLQNWSLERALTEPSNIAGKAKVLLTFQGVTMSQTDWAKKLGITQPALSLRLKKWPLEKALAEV